MSNKATIVFGILGVALIASAFLWRNWQSLNVILQAAPNAAVDSVVPHDPNTLTYTSQEYSVSLDYPKGYFIVEHETGTPQRAGHTIVIVQDTQSNRDLMSGKIKNSDGPMAITIQMFQNDLDHYATENWVRNTNDSNFKLSPNGVLTSATVANEPAVLYQWSGLYRGMTIAIARPDWVYAFSVSYDSTDDTIVTDFGNLLSTIRFQ